MDNKINYSISNVIYLDKLSLASAWRLFWIKKLKNIIVLDKIKTQQKIWSWILLVKGVNISEADFFAGSLKSADGESVRYKARRLCGEIALKSAKKIIEKNPEINRLNNQFKSNTIQLYIAKQLQLYIDDWLVRILAKQALSSDPSIPLLIKKPERFYEDILSEFIPEAKVFFYPNTVPQTLKLIKHWLFYRFRDFVLMYFQSKQIELNNIQNATKKSVLMFQEDTIRIDRTLRNQPHWFDLSNSPKAFNTFIIKNRVSKDNPSVKDISEFEDAGLKILPFQAIYSSYKLKRNNRIIQHIKKHRYQTFISAINAKSNIDKYVLLRIVILLRQAELIGSLTLQLNAKIVLFGEPQSIFTDAIQLFSKELNTNTVSFQYSNMGVLSPLMMTTADKFLIFSDMYKVPYKTDDISPKEIISTGYLYAGIADIVKLRAYAHRDKLRNAGAKFIICYFDESVQQEKWGFNNIKDHLDEIHILVKAILEDQSLGLVIKSQFMRNTPSNLYPADKLIKNAKVTGRYLELVSGKNRNDIYPVEAALASDICIGHKFGATASLEAAIAGIRSVLLNSTGSLTFFDSIYSQENIIYNNIGSLMESIKGLKEGKLVNQNLGDWKPILHHFNLNKNAGDRLRDVVNNYFDTK
jgi:hypothetical protein